MQFDPARWERRERMPRFRIGCCAYAGACCSVIRRLIRLFFAALFTRRAAARSESGRQGWCVAAAVLIFARGECCHIRSSSPRPAGWDPSLPQPLRRLMFENDRERKRARVERCHRLQEGGLRRLDSLTLAKYILNRLENNLVGSSLRKQFQQSRTLRVQSTDH